MLPPSSGWKSDCDLRNEEHDLAVGGARGGDNTNKWPLCCGKLWGGGDWRGLYSNGEKWTAVGVINIM